MRYVLLILCAAGCDFDADGLCMPPPCDTSTPCPADLLCMEEHSICVQPCDGAGGGCGENAKCRIDGRWMFCADADGLPIVSCPSSAEGETE